MSASVDRLLAMRLERLEQRVQELSAGVSFTDRLVVGTGSGGGVVLDDDPDDETIAVHGPSIVFREGHAAEEDCPRIVYNAGAFRFLADGHRGNAAGVILPPAPYYRMRGDGLGGITVVPATDWSGTSFTLEDDLGDNVYVYGPSLALWSKGQVWIASSADNAVDAGTWFYVADDGYTITTARAPGDELFFLWARMLGNAS